jgi:NAD(P)-binding Rossmann-like domain
MVVMEKIVADYVVVGSGAVGMAFCDVILKETNASIVVVDKHHAPGGHWNDAYPFIRLHQPSSYYGVCSKPLGNDAIETNGLNRGLLERASAADLLSYYDSLMREYVQSGRLRYFPMSSYQGEGLQGKIEGRFSGDSFEVQATRKIVDTTRLNTAVPATHPPKYSVANGIRCITPNDLVNTRANASNYTVVGSGKTGIDACLWLLETGVNPDSIRWISPRDAWFQNRANVQSGEDFFNAAFESFAVQMESVAQSTSIDDLFYRLESTKQLLRIDQSVTPRMYHGATMSEAELMALRRIRNVVRLGRLQSIGTQEMTLDKGSITFEPDTLFIDCSASGVENRPSVPVFSETTISPQFIKPLQSVFSAALIAHIEAANQGSSDDEKNFLCAPVLIPDKPIDWLLLLAAGLSNQGRWSKNEDIRNWMANTRLDPFSSQGRAIKATETDKLSLVKRYGTNVGPALENMKKLLSKA